MMKAQKMPRGMNLNLQKKRTFSAVAIALVATAILFCSVASAAMSVQINPAAPKTIKAGESIMYSALVYGNTGIPFYRWYIDDVPQPQFTSYTLSVSEAEAGTYKIYVHVESASIKVDSREVTLTVKAAPTAAPTEAPTATPTTQPVLSLPNVAIYAIVAVIGIIVIVAAVLVLFRKKK